MTKIYRNSFSYFSTGVGGIWNILALIIFVFSFLYLVKHHRDDYVPFSVFWGILFSVFSVGNALFTTFLEHTFSVSIYYYILTIPFFIAVLYAFFIHGRQGLTKSDKNLSIFYSWTLLLLVLVEMFFYKTGRLTFVLVADVYYLLCFVPILLLSAKSYVHKYGYLIAVFIAILFSNKRLGLICLIGFALINLAVKVWFSDNQKTKWNCVLGFGVFCVVSVFLYNYLGSIFHLRIIDRLLTISQDQGSGRLGMYKQLINAIFNSSVFEFIFGHGINTTGEVLIFHETAHNDILEIMYDYGLVPTILFITFYITLATHGLNMLKHKYKWTGVYVGLLFISAMLTMFSTYCVSVNYSICGMASTGLLLGDWKRTQEERTVYDEINNGYNS